MIHFVDESINIPIEIISYLTMVFCFFVAFLYILQKAVKRSFLFSDQVVFFALFIRCATKLREGVPIVPTNHRYTSYKNSTKKLAVPRFYLVDKFSFIIFFVLLLFALISLFHTFRHSFSGLSMYET